MVGLIRQVLNLGQASNKSRWVFVITQKQPVKEWPFQQILQDNLSAVSSLKQHKHTYTYQKRELRKWTHI